MSQGVLVVGTDTEVGKTIVCAALVSTLRKQGLDCGYVKPLASGCLPSEHGPMSPDAALVKRLARLPGPAASLTPVCLGPALAPLPAARLQGVEIDLAQVAESCRQAMETHAFTVVEGVGGLLVPITPNTTLLDLARMLDLPVLVVGRAGLGTINHTLLTIEALRNSGLAVLGFVFSAVDPQTGDDPSMADNPSLVTEFSGAPHLGTLPHLGPEENLTAEAVIHAARENLDLELLFPEVYRSDNGQ